MFREMRRNKQALSLEESIAVLHRGTSGVLAVSGEDDYPYAVPLSYVYHDGKLYFHCAKTGHKLDAIARNNKVSFCVIDQDLVMPEKYTTYFRSVIAFGRARILEEPTEKRMVLEKLAAKYSKDQAETHHQVIEQQFNHVCIIELTVDLLSGKEAIELVSANDHH